MGSCLSTRFPAGVPRGKHRRLAKKPEKPKGFFRRWWWVIVGLPLLGIAVVAGTLVWVYVHLELPNRLPPIQSTYVYDRNGDLLTTLHGSVDRDVIPFSQMPETLQHAILAAEDDSFYQHPGVDPLGIARAAWTDLVKRDTVQGGSTITQQVVKNVYAGTYETDASGQVTGYELPPRTIGQKIREALLAVKLESEQTKDQILATYLNTIYFGHGAYGIEAAAKTYFYRRRRGHSPRSSPRCSRASCGRPGSTTPSSRGTRRSRGTAATTSWTRWWRTDGSTRRAPPR